MFTGSGIPMRFAASNGSLIDVYQAATYSADDATDTPDTVVPAQMKTLIDNALGANGYYGAFTVIVHNDGPQVHASLAMRSWPTRSRRASRSSPSASC